MAFLFFGCLILDSYFPRLESREDEEADPEEDIHTLTSYSPVELSVDRNEFKMYWLVRFSTRKWLELN